ncbi:uncharacterized protein METZ01_LOCUS181995 [marine metagenome]|uniref:Uncharacterized protein n=1 Tax=marine metagenome TaxID=408172 RepID=A0A382CUB8_9ZZZZ
MIRFHKSVSGKLILWIVSLVVFPHVLFSQQAYPAANPTLLTMVDNINMWGLTLIGLALPIGIVERPAALVGIKESPTS